MSFQSSAVGLGILAKAAPYFGHRSLERFGHISAIHLQLGFCGIILRASSMRKYRFTSSCESLHD